MIQNILTSVIAFASTNIDDLFILMLFFGTKKIKSLHITIGQYLGISTLVIIALVGSIIGGKFIDTRYIGFLGLFPIYLGLKASYDLFKKKSGEDEPINLDFKKNDIIAIATVTFANGGDNIGVYIPLMSNLNNVEKTEFVGVFIVMIFVWCQISKYLANSPLVAKSLDKYAHIITPFVMVSLGVFILIESKTFSLF